MLYNLNASDTKLYHLTSPDFALPLATDVKGTVIRTPAGNIPMLLWPDGSWCLEGNAYMLALFQRGLSRRNGGGTLLTYAGCVSHLLRFCYTNRTDIAALTDNDFARFIHLLYRGKERASAHPSRNSNTVIMIGRVCLDFLSSVARLHGDPELVGEAGRIVTTARRIQTRGIARASSIYSQALYHRSFPTPDPRNPRFPIATDTIERLHKAVLDASSSIFQRKRRYVMLRLLEVTGGRRSEVAHLSVNSVLQARDMPEPFLKILTAKQRGGREDYRYIPISKNDLAFLIEFIEKNRSRIIRKTCGVHNDDGFLLISEKSGKQLRANTITQEVSILARHAGVIQKTCPHMFRHRFVTKLFVALIQQHNIESEGNIRKALLDLATMKQKVAEWTGHRRPDSLEPYIHLAFEEVTGGFAAIDAVQARQVISSLREDLAQLRDELAGGLSAKDGARTLARLVEAALLGIDSPTLGSFRGRRP